MHCEIQYISNLLWLDVYQWHKIYESYHLLLVVIKGLMLCNVYIIPDQKTIMITGAFYSFPKVMDKQLSVILVKAHNPRVLSPHSSTCIWSWCKNGILFTRISAVLSQHQSMRWDILKAMQAKSKRIFVTTLGNQKLLQINNIQHFRQHLLNSSFSFTIPTATAISAKKAKNVVDFCVNFVNYEKTACQLCFHSN